ESRNRATDFREYGIGAQILRDVGLGKIRLITNYPRRMVSLPGYGLEIAECVPTRLAPRRAGRTPRPVRAEARTPHSKSAARRSTSKAENAPPLPPYLSAALFTPALARA